MGAHEGTSVSPPAHHSEDGGTDGSRRSDAHVTEMATLIKIAPPLSLRALPVATLINGATIRPPSPYVATRKPHMERTPRTSRRSFVELGPTAISLPP